MHQPAAAYPPTRLTTARSGAPGSPAAASTASATDARVREVGGHVDDARRAVVVRDTGQLGHDDPPARLEERRRHRAPEAAATTGQEYRPFGHGSTLAFRSA